MVSDNTAFLRSIAAAPRVGAAPRILMALWDGGGNVPAQRAIARELRRRSCDVHVIGHDSVAQHLKSDGVTFHRLRSVVQFDFAAPRTLAEEVASVQHDVLGSESFAADVMSVHDEISPDILLIDCMLVSTLQAAVNRKTKFCVIHHLAWMPASETAAFMNHVYRSMPGQPVAAGFGDLLEAAALILVTSYAQFATEADVPSNVVFVGPVREPVGTTPWTRRHPDRPLVLVGLSSVHQQQGETLRNIGRALASLLVEALITTGRGISPDLVEETDNVQVRSHVDHDILLPLADLMVTHGGLGTASFCAGAGVPVLCLPNGRDQNDNAARIEAMGLGRTLSPDATPRRIAAAIEGMLADAQLRAACKAFALQVTRFGDLGWAAGLVLAQAGHERTRC